MNNDVVGIGFGLCLGYNLTSSKYIYTNMSTCTTNIIVYELVWIHIN